MKMRSRILCSAAIASAFALNACNNTIAGSPVYIGVSITPRPATLAVGGTMVFTATVSNNLSLPQWSLLDSSYSSNPGTLTPVAGSPNEILYTAPATPPIYTQTPTGITQGTITVDLTTTAPPGTSSPISPDAVSFVITAPSVSVALTPAKANVALGSTLQLIGYAVGNVNNTLTWQVNGVTGGALATTGTIVPSGLYVAPTTMPMSGNTVTITIIFAGGPHQDGFLRHHFAIAATLTRSLKPSCHPASPLPHLLTDTSSAWQCPGGTVLSHRKPTPDSPVWRPSLPDAKNTFVKSKF